MTVQWLSQMCPALCARSLLSTSLSLSLLRLSVSSVVAQARLNLCFTSSVFRNPMGIFDLEIKFVWEIFFLLLKSCTMSCIQRIVCILTRSSSLRCIRGVDREASFRSILKWLNSWWEKMSNSPHLRGGRTERLGVREKEREKEISQQSQVHPEIYFYFQKRFQIHHLLPWLLSLFHFILS